ncbi:MULTISPECIES: serine/threonine-protein kinase [Oscillatoriales]|uniref:Serine/threonine protein kinase with WD40 repeats n=1 Tax=Limnospira maxima CS-328 TaxID=513049 RepID=B5VU27_LIMMA|nr:MULTISPECIES: serine/threonine-protein kinase [Oscillatoriales]MDC0836448.1 serine/threonine protein kinase [Limnoraphis robusta]MDY7052427.1 serine/threonine-protein kinase [Limnospira fusiformis LS22]QJB28297.1 protein kinase [Limnospira fusiformis SAG 85.79]EDZ97043.1 serine/threonine protein kinase with WD40 repeats [Limnospira maxima CS-328]MBD2572344.1 serine/threonine protein kinase [Arthrospira platensis FACHB-971]
MIDQLLDRRYQILEVIESGDLGSTFLARDTRRPGECLCFIKHLRLLVEDIKLLNIARRRFRQEAKILEKLSRHDQIPQLLAYFEENEEFYLVESYTPGHLLSDEFWPGHPLSENLVIQIIYDVLEILTFVHRFGVIHRDIKPSNLLRRDSDGKLMLLDFGAVKEISFSQNHNPPTGPIGTIEYMPIEQFECNPRLNSDIYAVGMVAIQALTGLPSYELSQLRENYHTNPGQLFWRHLTIVSSEFADIIDRMVQLDYRERYQSAEEVLTALRTMGDRSPTDFSKLQTYREEIQRCASHKGDISVVGRQILEELRVTLEISKEEAEALEDEILNPYRKYREKGERYEQALIAAVKQQYPFSAETQSELDRLKELLGIYDEDVEVIKSHVLPKSGWSKILDIFGDNPRTEVANKQPKSSVAFRPRPSFWLVIGGISLAIAMLLFLLYQYQRWQQLQLTRANQQQLYSQQFETVADLVQAGNYQGCITQAQQIPESSSYHPQAQTVLEQCQSVVNWKQADLTTLAGHTAPVMSVAASNDGEIIASGSRDNTIKLWNTQTGENISTLTGDGSAILSVNFSSDGIELASGTEFWRILEWNLQTRELYLPLEHSAPILTVQISPNNRNIASGSADNTVRVWDRRTGQVLYNHTQHSETVYALAFSPNGRWLVTGSGDRTVHVIDLEMRELRHRLQGHNGEVRAVAITPDGQNIISGSSDNTIKIWDLQTGQETITLTGHQGEILSVAVSPDASQIASSSGDRTVRIWNRATGELLNTLTDIPAVINSVFFLNDDTLIGGSQNGTVAIWRRQQS